MRIHRSNPKAGFTILPNGFLKNRRLSLLARGLLAYLMSFSDSTHQDIKTLAAENPEGQQAIARAMRELTAHGYLIRRRFRDEAGKMRTVVDVYDTPQHDRPDTDLQVTSALGKPSLGETSALPTGVKKELQETTPSPGPAARRRGSGEPVWPAKPPPDGGDNESDGDGEDGGDDGDGGGGGGNGGGGGSAAPGIALLTRLGRAEPRLTVGETEMAPVLPLLAEWLARGSTETQIRTVLTVGLPDEIRSPAKLIMHRLRTKLPAPAPMTAPARLVVRTECDDCARPVPNPGRCPQCADTRTRKPAPTADVKRGATLARELLKRPRPMAA
ncbi:helix-turn-helix domain-containing protein [Streptosporangium sp. NPDC002544]|uniref:helix-turn-helix domain-containing protein n=1 Tax=Streptosporangium sp. NPDC002544 TaxID=3154538 RepID=UPI003333C2C2